MKMSTPTSLWCYCSYALKWNAGKVYKRRSRTIKTIHFPSLYSRIVAVVVVVECSRIVAVAVEYSRIVAVVENNRIVVVVVEENNSVAVLVEYSRIVVAAAIKIDCILISRYLVHVKHFVVVGPFVVNKCIFIHFNHIANKSNNQETCYSKTFISRVLTIKRSELLLLQCQW